MIPQRQLMSKKKQNYLLLLTETKVHFHKANQEAFGRTFCCMELLFCQSIHGGLQKNLCVFTSYSLVVVERKFEKKV